MKKLLRNMLVLSIILSSCTKEPNFVVNFSYPIDENDPTGVQGGSNFTYIEGESVETLVSRIKREHFKHPNILFIGPVYDLSQVEETPDHLKNYGVKYSLFPYAISSISDHFGWDHYDELKEQQANNNIQPFLDKYCEGDSTLGMKLNPKF